jgi:SAM-dependent methyltransferase
MTDVDKFNHIPAEAQDAIDERNKDFYGRFPYPWSALTFPFVADPHYGTVFLNQDLGDWTHSRIPHNPRIWVAGCGTNQAVLTALRFPQAEVLGTDLSTPSLALSQEAASRLGIQNLRLEEQSLNASRFQEEFDYIICTGDIHHNAHPAITLRNLSAALKRDGILELMVYNSSHMLLPTTYQKFIHQLFPGEAALDLDAQLLLTKALIDTFPVDNKMAQYLHKMGKEPDVALADLLLQPVEHCYTIESLAELLKETSLEFWLPCVNRFDKDAEHLTWNMAFDHELVSRYYDVLSDVERWHISNLLLHEQSPMLWFYVQRSDSSFKRKSEQEICDSFLGTKFAQKGLIA